MLGSDYLIVRPVEGGLSLEGAGKYKYIVDYRVKNNYGFTSECYIEGPRADKLLFAAGVNINDKNGEPIYVEGVRVA